jgi:hypothetical protein
MLFDLDRSGLLIPSGQSRYLSPGKLPHKPTEALLLHGLFNNILHLRDRAIFTDEFSVPVTKTAIGLASASISFCSPAAGVF